MTTNTGARTGRPRQSARMAVLRGGQVTVTPPPEPGFAGDAPTTLSPAATAIWEALAPGLVAKGWLTSGDVPLFSDLCEARARLDAAWRAIARDGEFVAGSHGQTARHPGFMVVTGLTPHIVTLSRFFGIAGPESREHLAPAPEPAGRGDDLLSC